MYTMIPFRSHRTLNQNRPSSLFDDRFFRSFFDMNDWMGSAGFRVDIHEEKDHYLMEAELPGVPQEQISITADQDTLTISADMRSERNDEKAYYSERRMGHVSRSFSLEGIDENAITADYKNGILYVNMPKKQPCRDCSQRRIPIGSGSEETQA